MICNADLMVPKMNKTAALFPFKFQVHGNWFEKHRLLTFSIA